MEDVVNVECELLFEGTDLFVSLAWRSWGLASAFSLRRGRGRARGELGRMTRQARLASRVYPWELVITPKHGGTDRVPSTV